MDELKNKEEIEKRTPVSGLKLVLLAGLMLRAAVFCFQGPSNNDNHYSVVEYIAAHYSLPQSDAYQQADNPPLYYVLAALVTPLGQKAVQGFSLLLSMAALYFLYLLLSKIIVPGGERVKVYCLMLAAFMPQFVMFGNYISNDPLSFLIGALIFLRLYEYIYKPSQGNRNLLALCLGLGLLTKGSFFVYLPVLAAVVVMVSLKQTGSWRRGMAAALFFILIVSALGSFKVMDNIQRYHKPLWFSIDRELPWMQSQRPTYEGLSSFYDINVSKLIIDPVLGDSTKHSYPLLLYGTFWYQYIAESDLRGNLTGFRYLGSLIYILALVPTALFALGFVRTISSAKTLLSFKSSEGPAFKAALFDTAVVLLLLSNLLMILSFGHKYDLWSWFQARYLFISFFAFMLLLARGLDAVREKAPILQKMIYPCLACLYGLFAVYFSIEIYLKLRAGGL